MTVLITGGTGNTGIRLAHRLHQAGHPILLTSRTGKAPDPYKAVQFEWFDPSTFQNPFDADSNIDRVYLVGPVVVDMLTYVKPFIDFAASKGVKRFVLLSASATEKGEAAMGEIHEYLVEKGVDYVVLRPSWFFGMCNTRTSQAHFPLKA